VSGRITGRPRGPLPTGTAQDFLNGVCESEAIVWYFDSAKLYFSAANEIDSLMISLGPVRLQELPDSLDKLGIADSRYPLGTSQRAGMVMVNGPPRYVALVRLTFEMMRRCEMKMNRRPPVGDFPPYYR
jgi:type III secretion protein C